MSLASQPQRVIGLASLGDKVAQSLSRDTLGARADRIDRVLNFRILPQLGIHAALIGTCVLIANDSAVIPRIPYAFLAAGFFAGFIAAHVRGWKGSGLLSASATFATAAVITSASGQLDRVLLLALVTAALAFVVMRWNVSRREMVFAPIYAAILILLTTPDAGVFALYAPIFLIGMTAVVIGGHISWSFGLFIGLLILVSNRFDDTAMAVVGVLSIVGLVLLVIYVGRSVSSGHSDLRNFFSQGLGAWVFMALVGVFVGELDPWVIPLLMTIFFLIIALFKGALTGAPTAVAWLFIAALIAFWSYLGDASYSRYLAWSMITHLTAKLLDLAARKMRIPLVNSVALLIIFSMVIAATISILVLQWEDELPGDVQHLLSWSDNGLLKLLILAALPIVAIASCYRPIVPSVPIPWWRGLVRPRHVLFVRTCYRASETWVSAAPLIGTPLRAVGQAFRALRYLKTGGERLRLADVLLIATVLMFFVSLRQIAILILERITLSGGTPASWSWAAGSIAAAVCGLVFYGLGLLLRQSLFFFIGALLLLGQFAFHLISRWSVIEADQVGMTSVLLGLVLVLCAGVRAQWSSATNLPVTQAGH